MRIAVVGPGRAVESAVCLAARRAGHDVVAVAARSRTEALRAAQELVADPVEIGHALPGCDLVIVARSPTSRSLRWPRSWRQRFRREQASFTSAGPPRSRPWSRSRASGSRRGPSIPCKRCRARRQGAMRLAGSWIAITADEPLRSDLGALARSMAANPFDLAEDAKELYHAARLRRRTSRWPPSR